MAYLKGRMLVDIMKFPFHHRAFYCYLAMSLWIFFLIAGMYKYISVEDEPVIVKRVPMKQHLSKADIRFRKIYLKACNPPDSIVRGSEAAVDHDTWLLQGVLVITRHGDRGPLTHLRGGEKLPCDTMPPSPLLKSYEEFVHNVSGGASRGPWASGPGAFHNFPTLPVRDSTATHCPLGQLTPMGLLQMLTIGAILKDAYAEKLGIDVENFNRKDTGEIVSWSTKYRRTYQSMLGTLWGFSNKTMPRVAVSARESHAVAFCFHDCACAANSILNRKITSQSKQRLDAHPTIKELVKKMSNVLYESQENTDPEIIKDALLAYMCHDAPLPCSEQPKNLRKFTKRKVHDVSRSLLASDLDIPEDYGNNLDFSNEIGKKAKDIMGNYDLKGKPLDFDAQMEREKLLYYQQRYLDNEGYDDVVVVKKNLDPDFNFPDLKPDVDFDEDYKDPTPQNKEDFCIKKEHIVSLYSYLEWNYRQEMKNVQNKRKGLLLAYGLVHNIVKYMIKIISEGRPKFVLYSGHDKTINPLIIALGLFDYHQTVSYGSRMIFEMYRKKDLRDEFQFSKRKAVAQDFYFRVVLNGLDVTNELSFCKTGTIVMKVVDPIDDLKVYNTYLCPIENIVRFIHDDYFALFNVSNFKDACGTYKSGKFRY